MTVGDHLPRLYATNTFRASPLRDVGQSGGGNLGADHPAGKRRISLVSDQFAQAVVGTSPGPTRSTAPDSQRIRGPYSGQRYRGDPLCHRGNGEPSTSPDMHPGNRSDGPLGSDLTRYSAVPRGYRWGKPTPIY